MNTIEVSQCHDRVARACCDAATGAKEIAGSASMLMPHATFFARWLERVWEW